MKLFGCNPILRPRWRQKYIRQNQKNGNSRSVHSDLREAQARLENPSKPLHYQQWQLSARRFLARFLRCDCSVEISWEAKPPIPSLWACLNVEAQVQLSLFPLFLLHHIRPYLRTTKHFYICNTQVLSISKQRDLNDSR
jgi:hypothetical protein